MASVLAFILLAAVGGEPLSSVSSARFSDPPLQEPYRLVTEGKAPEAISALKRISPDEETYGPYGYLYARAMIAAGGALDALPLYRQAYLYSPDEELRKKALIERAEACLSIRYYHEAAAFFRYFMKRFPGPAEIGRARTGLGESLYGMGRYPEAERQFGMAGDSPRAVFGRANALQRMGSVAEAAAEYDRAYRIDADYPSRSDETLWCIAENLRRRGDLARAKNHLESLTGEAIRARAAISLGRIALEESRAADAVKRFEDGYHAAAGPVKAEALLGLAEGFEAVGKTDESRKALAEIVNGYPFGEPYGRAILLLSRMERKSVGAERAVSLLLQVILRPSPVRREALHDLEEIIVGAAAGDDDTFRRLWRAGGQWMLDSSREASLLSIVRKIGESRSPYLEIVTWLSRYGSRDVRKANLMKLAVYHGIRKETAMLAECLEKIRRNWGSPAMIRRASALMAYAQGDLRGSAEKLLSLPLSPEDVPFLGEALSDPGIRDRVLPVYETAVRRFGGGPNEMVRLADALFESGRTEEALAYYRSAADGGAGNEWAMYRAGVLSGKRTGPTYLERIRKDPLLTRLARGTLREFALAER